MARAIAQAEDRARHDDAQPKRITPDDMKRAEAEHLIDTAHLQLYVEWQAMSGGQPSVSLTELLSMPAAMRHDFALIAKYIGEEREAVAAARKAKQKAKRKS